MKAPARLSHRRSSGSGPRARRGVRGAGAALSSRAVAARVISAVIVHGASLSKELPPALETLDDAHQRAFAQACTYGVLRHFFSLRARLHALLSKPLRKKDADIEALLLIGLYQLEHMQVPEHAAVAETVEAARRLRKEWATSLVNAVLRKTLRRQDRGRRSDESVEFEHPPWLIGQLQDAWGECWREILSANNAHAPMTLRINATKISRDRYLEGLDAAGVSGCATAHSPVGVKLARPVATDLLPGFADGWASVQDEAAQLAVEVLDPATGNHILDACAAPGGKTAHILEAVRGDCALLAIDLSAARMHDTDANLGRLALHAETTVADARQPAAWWNGHTFDRILLDAPCSATGVIRRHPDIKLNRHPTDIVGLMKLQHELLVNLWPLLHPGGKLLYATCSILPGENDGAVAKLMQSCDDVRVETVALQPGRATEFGRQILPGEDDMDGFYYALLSKRGAG